jgi:predicted enzyme related to lactoylglutathione lyase
MSYPIVHWEIGGHDSAALREFYAKAFGWTMTEAGPGYTVVQPTGDGLGGGIMQVPEGTPPYVTVYVKVDDLDGKLEEIRHLGGKVVVAPTEIDSSMSFALFADPQGAVVGLLRTVAPVPGANVPAA